LLNILEALIALLDVPAGYLMRGRLIMEDTFLPRKGALIGLILDAWVFLASQSNGRGGCGLKKYSVAKMMIIISMMSISSTP